MSEPTVIVVTQEVIDAVQTLADAGIDGTIYERLTAHTRRVALELVKLPPPTADGGRWTRPGRCPNIGHPCNCTGACERAPLPGWTGRLGSE